MYHDILPNFSITPSQVKLVKETSVVKFHAMDLKRKLSKIIGVYKMVFWQDQNIA